jgi:hypothetical protein
MLGGPRVRAYVTDAGTERWVFWEGRLRADVPMIEASIRGSVELWRVFSGDVNLAGAFDRGGGIAGGVLARIPRAPVWFSLSYALDRATQAAGAREDTVERLTFGLIVGSPGVNLVP